MGGTDESGESGSESGGSEGASASSTTTTSASGGTTTSTSTSESGSGEESDGSSGVESSSEEAGDSTGIAGAPSYDPCTSDEQCTGGTCLLADAADAGYCTSTCEAHEECEGYPMLENGLTISCAGTWGPNGEPLCILSCFQDPPGECPVGTTCGTHDYNGEPSNGLCG